jgi:hypothetical protein
MFAFHDSQADPQGNGSWESKILDEPFEGYTGPQVYEPDVWGFNPYTNPEPPGNLYERFLKNVVECSRPSGASCVKPLLYGEFGVPGNTHKKTDEPYPVPWTAENFVWDKSPPPAQCLSQGDLTSPPGSGGDGPMKEFKLGETIAVELPAVKSDKYDMPERLTKYFEESGAKEGDNLPAVAQAKWIKKFWKVSTRHEADNDAPPSEMKFASGGFVFEYRDEWWKANPVPYFHSITGNNTCTSACQGSCDTGAANPVFPGGWGDEQWFGIAGAKVANGRNPKFVIDETNGKLLGGPDILLPRAAVVEVCRMFDKCLTPLEQKRKERRKARAAE